MRNIMSDRYCSQNSKRLFQVSSLPKKQNSTKYQIRHYTQKLDHKLLAKPSTASTFCNNGVSPTTINCARGF